MIKYISYYLNNTLLKVRQVFFIELENITAAIADSNPIEGTISEIRTYRNV